MAKEDDGLTKGQKHDVRTEIEEYFSRFSFTDRQTEKLASIISNAIEAGLSKDRENIASLRTSTYYIKWVLSLNLVGMLGAIIGAYK